MKYKRRLQSFLQIILLRNFSLMVKLCTYFALLILIPMSIVGIISYKQSASTFENEAAQYNMQIMEQVKKHVEYYVRDLQLNTLKVVKHPDIIDFLAMKSPEEVEQSGIRESVQSILTNTVDFRSDINNITIISEGIQVIDLLGVKGVYPAGNILEEFWYQSVPDNGDIILVSRKILWQDRMEPVVSIARKVINPQTLEPSGMIVVDINFKRFQEIAEKVQVGQTGFMFILDSQGYYIYHPNLNLLGSRIDIKEPLESTEIENGGYLITNNTPKNFLTYSSSSQLGWTLVVSTLHSEVTKGIKDIGRTILITSIIALIIASLLGVGLSKSIIRPIRKLQQFARHIENGDFSASLKVESKDEVGQLTQGFNVMVGKLSQLLEEISQSRLKETQMSLTQKETDLKVLQSQVNPHFLYNSLETIRGMALDKGMDDIGDMSASLARLLRYNLRNSSPTISLNEELSACKVYLRIQKYRFDEKLEYDINLDWALDQTVVKFCLQPLVENCINHAANYSQGKTRITISAEQDTSSSFLIKIADNGDGISDDTLQKVRAELSKKEVSFNDKHIGIINVHQRIAYIYGDEYGLSIERNSQNGTTVTLRFPLLDIEQERSIPC